MADAFHLGDTVPKWEPPTTFPAKIELLNASQQLATCLQPATNTHIAWCLMVMLKTFSHRGGDEFTIAMISAGWIIAVGDMPDDLWYDGTEDLLRTKNWMPQPVDMLKAVGPKWHERQRMRSRINWMLQHFDDPKPEPPKPLTRIDRLRIVRDNRRNYPGLDGSAKSSAEAELLLAKLESRPPELTEAEQHALVGRITRIIDRSTSVPTRPLSVELQITQLRNQARTVRAQGNWTFADYLNRQADALMPIPESQDFGEDPDREEEP